MKTVPIGLDARQRSTLERLVIRARALLESDLAAQAEGRFGIHLDGTVEDESALPDDATEQITRRDLEQIVSHLRTLGEDSSGAVARVLREAAFTHLNRLVAIRIAEEIGLLPESIAAGPQSRGFKDIGEIMPILAGDYRAYVRLCGDELAADAPTLFDPRNPLLALEPTTAAFDELVALMADPEAAELWLAPDTLGWAYQFFNTSDERREMREAPAPRNSRELAVRNQFFTPRYVVDFLVQNTIGRRLIENDPTSPLLDELPLLVDTPTEVGPPIDLEDVKCLDPACGSGHFLLGCYDVLERAWDLAGTPPSASAPKVVDSLWGVDIDPRCAQVASAAIVLRARRHCRDLPLPRPHIITARGLPGGSAALPADLNLSAGQLGLIDRVSEALAEAPSLGTLLKAETALDREIRHGVFGGKSGTLELSAEAAEATERELLGHLRAIADQASSSVVERLLAAEADDALRLVDVVRQRYDAVLMNPPFGEPVPGTKPYLRAAYPWLPTKDANLLAAFVGRGLELCSENGYLGAITSRAGMFLTTFETWRRQVVLGNHLVAFADLGLGVMEQALVEAAAYVIGPGKPDSGTKATFVRLLKDVDRAGGLTSAIAAARADQPDTRIYHAHTAEFENVPGVPLAYWLNASFRRLFVELPQLEGSGPEARQGLATGDDFRFVRVSWEVDPRRIAAGATETGESKRWSPFAKGGEYSPYWADIHLLLDYERDGEVLRSLSTSRVQNTQYYFRPGLTWPLRTASGFSPRILPAGCVFGHKGPAILEGSPLVLLAWLTSRLADALMATSQPAGDETSSGTASKSYEVGLVQHLPWPGPVLDENVKERLADYSRRIAERRRSQDNTDETARLFVAPSVPSTGASVRQTAITRYAIRGDGAIASISDAAAAERALAEALALGADAFAYLDEEVGPHPDSYPKTQLENEAEFAQLFEVPMDQLIDHVIADRGGSRAVATMTFIADRRIEVLAHGLRRHPSVLQEAAQRLGLLPPGELSRTAEELFSYLIGVAFGRWDVRIGRNPCAAPPAPGLFDAVPACSPGMLVGDDGMPQINLPPDYPLELPPERLLVDEPGHDWDVELSVQRAAGALVDDPGTLVADLLEILGRKSIRDYVRKQFFKDHLTRYSRSRRKAPIYWPLTVPSKRWGVWVYAPALTRETLYAVAREAGRRERLAGEAIARLQREQLAGSPGSLARKMAEERDFEEKLAEELHRFGTEAQRVAGLGWKPDLDDGIILCAAPLADLFPHWPDAKTARADLRKGNYEWSAVAAWAEQL